MIKNEYSELLEKIHEIEVNLARIQEQLAAMAAALVIADKKLEHSQAVSNEWRKENIDQRALYLTIEKAEGMLNTLRAEMHSIEARVRTGETGDTKTEGSKKAWSAMWAIAIILIGWAIAAAVIYFAR